MTSGSPAGDAHLGDAELRGDAHRAQQLLLRQHIRVAPLADTLGGHAVLAAKVAKLRDGDAQIGDRGRPKESVISIPSECTSWEMARLAEAAEAAVAKADEVFMRQAVARVNLREQHVEDRRRHADGRTGDAEDRHIAEIRHERHVARLRRDAVRDDLRAELPDGGGREVVRSTDMPPVKIRKSAPWAR